MKIAAFIKRDRLDDPNGILLSNESMGLPAPAEQWRSEAAPKHAVVIWTGMDRVQVRTMSKYLDETDTPHVVEECDE